MQGHVLPTDNEPYKEEIFGSGTPDEGQEGKGAEKG